MFVTQGEASNRCYAMEDPLACMPHFDSSMIDLSNPSEIFQFEKADVPAPYALVPDMSVPTSHGYPEAASYTHSPLASYDLNIKPRPEFSYAQ